MNILDCTLRDGGYYNKWDFESDVVKAYLKAMASAKIDYVELGLRNFAKSGFLGAYAYTTEKYLNRMDLPHGPIYGVMVDAKTVLSSKLSVDDAVATLFVSAAESKLSLVRIAAHFHEVESCGEIVKALKKLGYIVGFNLMQSGGKASEVITEKAKIASSWDCLDVLYFADSLGNMDVNEVKRIIGAIRKEWSGELGIHTHNNMAKALDNSLAAKELGVNWIDATVTGMGRGAGNAQTENLLAILSQNTDKYIASYVYELVLRHFEKMQKRHGWGSNLMYFLGAQHNVHPTYIQNLLSDTHFGTEEIIGAIEYLKDLESSSSYDIKNYKKATSFLTVKTQVSGSTSLNGIAKGKEVLILANGPSLTKYLNDIKAYIVERKPIVIAINICDVMSPEFIDYYCVSRNTKFLSEREKYNKLKKPLILPLHRFTNEEIKTLECLELYDFGMTVESGALELHSSSCVAPYDVTTAYALCVGYNTEASQVSVVGFDGYNYQDERQLEMVEILTLFKNLSKDVKLVSLTPSTYPIAQESLYAPTI